MVESLYFKSLIGSLRYLTASRSNILYEVSLLSQYMETSTQDHLQAGKTILRCIRGALSHNVVYSFFNNVILVGYLDSVWVGDVYERKDASENVFILEKSVFRWFSKKQKVTALSTVEGEYIAATSWESQVILLRRLVDETKHPQYRPTTM